MLRFATQVAERDGAIVPAIETAVGVGKLRSPL
jgi:hypothetical protein